MYQKRSVTRAQFLDRLGMNKATRKRVQYILDEIEKLSELSYVTKGGNQYLQAIFNHKDELSVGNGGCWRLWIYADEDAEAIILYLLAELQEYNRFDESLPF